MSSSQVSRTASRMIRYGNSRFRSHFSAIASAAAAAAVVTPGLINGVYESQFRSPFCMETLNPILKLSRNSSILNRNQIRIAGFPGVEQARSFSRGNRVKSDDESDDEFFDSFDDDDDTDFEDGEDFSEDGDEYDAADTFDEDPGNKRRRK